MRLLSTLLLLPLLAAAGPVAKSSYLGTWKIVSSDAAPWVKPEESFGRTDADKLNGKRITFGHQRIAGPSPLGCSGPRYEIKYVPAHALFQGNLSDPNVQARALGFPVTQIATLETACEALIEFHFLSNNEALFALNNRLYRMRRIGG